MIRRLTFAVPCLVLLCGLTSATAQTVPTAVPVPSLDDARWTPWLGCWRSTDDLAGTGARVCVAPSPAGVTLSTLIGGQRVSSETRVADGRPHAVADAGCTGTATMRWSPRGARLYRTSSIACDGGAPRTLTSVGFFADGPTWVEVETVDDRGTLRVRASRLVRARNEVLADGTAFVRPAGRALTDAVSAWTVDDVLELSQALPADGVQAAIAEGRTAFSLNAKTLATMADHGVGPLVIDLMVGLTYPSKFVVQRASGGLSLAGMGAGVGSLMADPFFAPILGPAAMFNCYSPMGWAMTDYWSNCAMFNPMYYSRYPGYYSGYWGAFGSDWIETQASTIGTGSAVTTGAAPSRLINGRGYTQVRPVDATASFPTGNGTNGTMGDASGGSTSGSTSGGSVSGSGYSGGGASSGGGDGGRTAVPRGPGGQ